jgi:secondary thiamine-phosphate synthase enzyme
MPLDHLPTGWLDCGAAATMLVVAAATMSAVRMSRQGGEMVHRVGSDGPAAFERRTPTAEGPTADRLRQAQGAIGVRTRGQGLYDVTDDIAGWLLRQQMASGLLSVFCRHTSASLIIQENADPDVQRDLQAFFRRLVREDKAFYRHVVEGEDDMPAHIRSALTLPQVSIPVGGGKLLLGRWQSLYLFEHRAAPQHRDLVLHLIGS